MMHYLITFATTAQAIKAENIFLKNELKIKIRPLPNEISFGCGLSITFDDLTKVKAVIVAEKLKYDKIYIIENKEYREIS